MPPTWSAAVRRSLCWGFAATWPLYGLFWGFWLRSSSWSSSSLFMRSVRSQMTYRTVSHQRWCLALFYDLAVFDISEEKLVLLFNLDMNLSCDWIFLHPKTLSVWCWAMRWLWKEARYVFGVCLTHSFARDTNTVTWHCALPAFNNSVWRSWPNRQTLLQEVTPCQDNFMHLIFMRKMILQCCRVGLFQLLMAFQGPCAVPKLQQASPRDTSFSYTTCVCHPGIV